MTPISYKIAEAAKAVGVSVSAIRAAYRSGALPVHYPTSHPVVMHDDLMAWVANAPTERAETA